MYDVVIIGAGICGCSIAYELSKYQIKTAVLEKENDVADGTTKANSAIVHAGYDPKPGTLMAKYNVRGSQLYQELCGKLSVPYQQIGSLVLAFDSQDQETIRTLYQRGEKNGVPGLKILAPEELFQLEPNVSRDCLGALYAPTAAIVSPWEMAIALAEVAVENGVSLFLENQVLSIQKEDAGYSIQTNQGVYRAKYVVNAAGVHADEINNMVASPVCTIVPNKGQYYILDKSQGGLVSHVVFQCPSKAGKGVLVSPTVHGNLIVGPDAEDVPEKEDFSTSREGLEFVLSRALQSAPGIQIREAIRNFAGVRAISERDDFIVGESPEAKGFINVAGIKSPGLTSAPAIAEDMIRILGECGLSLAKKEAFRDSREKIEFRRLSPEGRAAAVKRNPLYGRVICRCETVTEGEIVDALHRPIPPRSVDAAKRRCNCGMGRCQGGFCGPRVQEIISRELGIPMEAVPMDKTGTTIILDETKRG